jgi:hypothetical protein
MKTNRSKPAGFIRLAGSAGLAISLLVLLTGCVGIVLPVPSDGNTYGKVITREQVSFIVPGKTTREEVIARLGDQFRASPRLPALAYSWEKPAIGWTWGIAGLEGGAAGAYVEGSHWRALFVRFDERERVVSIRFVSLSGRKSLDERLENWAVEKKHDFNEIGAKIFDPDNGVPWIVEDMKAYPYP